LYEKGVFRGGAPEGCPPRATHGGGDWDSGGGEVNDNGNKI